MAGIIAASWRPKQARHAKSLFERACRYYEHFKGLRCEGKVLGRTYGIARFPSRNCPCPDIYEPPENDLIFAGAGWWFDPEAPGDKAHGLEWVADCYAKEADRALHRLQGQYLIAVCDPRKNETLACGDSLGMFPFYVAESEGIGWCCTSAIVLAATLGAKPDAEAIRGLFADGAIRSPHSAFTGIKKVGIGQQVLLADGRVQMSRVWSPFQSPRQYRRIEDAAEECLGLVQRSCRHIHRIWPDCVSDLTAGLDSRLVVSVVAGLGLPVRLTVTGQDDDLDVVIARRVAERFGWPIAQFAEPADWGQQRWELFEQGVNLAEGELPGSAIDGTIRVKRELSETFDAALSGGGGELYRDFFWQQEFFKIGRTSELDLSRVLRYRFFFSAGPDMSIFTKDWWADYVSDQVRTAEDILESASDALNTAKLDALYLWKSSGHVARYCGSINPIIASPLPLLNRELFDFLAAVPWKYRIGGKLARHIIARAHRGLAAMPTWYGGTAEPMSITRPMNYLSYCGVSFKKLVRKFSQLTIKRPIFRDPCLRAENPAANTDFVGVLEHLGLLDIDNYRSLGLYDADGLRRFLSRARDGDVRDFNQLYAIITVESLQRLCESARAIRATRKIMSASRSRLKQPRSMV